MVDSAETNYLDAKMCINFYLVWLKAKVIDHCQCLAPSYRHPCVSYFMYFVNEFATNFIEEK